MDHRLRGHHRLHGHRPRRPDPAQHRPGAERSPPNKLTLLFGVYVGVQCVAMLLTGWAASRFGPKRTLTVGLVLIVIAAGISAFAGNIDQLIAFRVIWGGLGNALFLATALAFIVSSAKGSRQGAIMMYEAALGIGLAVGPLIGATLGEWTWRAPFGGTAVLMFIGAVLCAVMLPPADGPRNTRAHVRIIDPLKALRNRTLLIAGFGSAFYTGALFTVIAWAPIAMGSARSTPVSSSSAGACSPRSPVSSWPVRWHASSATRAACWWRSPATA